LDEDDEENSEIVSIYPYKNPRDKNNDGKRYNLLPRVGKIDPDTGVASPQQPFGSFPIKEEVVTNPTYLQVYKKYYKYSTVTNDAGDYMIFGIPTGVQTVHMSCDITDIGAGSMTPAAMVTNLGYSPNLFKDNNTRIKESNDLDDLPNIDTQEISVDVIPFWGDTENFEIGITRVDFRIRAQLTNTFVIFGAAYTDGDGSMWGYDYRGGLEVVELYRMRPNENVNLGIVSKRIGVVDEKIYYYPNSVSDAEINSSSPQIDPKDKMLILSDTEYSKYKRDGDFVYIISCNRRKVITSETGEERVVADDYPGGVFTQFRGFMTFEISTDSVPMDFSSYLDDDNFPRGRIVPIRYKFKIPQSAQRGNSFRKEDDSDDIDDTNAWRREHATFEAGKYYSVSRFHGIVWNGTEGEYDPSNDNGFLNTDTINDMSGNLFNTVAGIQTNDFGTSGNTAFQMPSNALTDSDQREVFVANWMNFSLYMPQTAFNTENYNRIRDMRSNSNFTQNFRYTSYYFKDNTQPIAAGDFNTKWFARSDIHWTSFIEVPTIDIRTIIEELGTQRGFKLSDLSASLEGNYKNGQSSCPLNGGKINARPTNGTDTETYFFRGFDSSDCLGYLAELGLL
jgi:hypothetical protein